MPLSCCLPFVRGDRSRVLPSVLFALAVFPLAFGLSAAAAQTNPPSAKFFLGADITALDAPGHGRWQLPAYQEDGKPSDELTILEHHGWTAFRVRVFVAPVRNAPNNTLEAAIPLAKRIKASGAIFVLDIHFSDTWADPQHQEIPVAWRGMEIGALAKEWKKYAHDTVKAFKDAGAMPDIVEIGNEITRGTAWPLAQLEIPGSNLYLPPQPYDEAVQWKHLAMLLKAGIRGVRSAGGGTPARIAIHIDQGGHWEPTEWFFDHLAAQHVPYDIIAESFYPPWGHGTLDGVRNNMNRCAERFHKDFLVMETGYEPSHVANNDNMLWPVTAEGRLQFMVDLVNTVQNAPLGMGVLYWAPERDLWNADGSAGPGVFTLDRLDALGKGTESHAPAAGSPP
jgi:arabinogalactan endo-1,4-beta-galactosidase